MRARSRPPPTHRPPRSRRFAGAPMRLAGTVRGDGGAPVAGARVTLAEVSPGLGTARGNEVVTDAAGGFALCAQAYRAALLLVRAAGYLPEVVAARCDGAGIEVALAAAGAVSGKLVDGSGVPLAGARVRAVSRDAMDLGEDLADSAGRFAIAALRPGRYVVTATRGGVALAAVTLDVAAGAAAEVALHARRAASIALC